MSSAPTTRVALFCGGRGSATILRALLDRPGVQTTLLVNAYDDGRSTGMLRRLLGDLPAPSDFRKNLSVLLDRRSPALAALLEARLAAGEGHREIDERLARLAPEDVREALRDCAGKFFGHWDAPPDLGDCAVGNVLLTGAFLAHERDFNRALAWISDLLKIPARLYNVDEGIARHLVALRADGTLLACEAAIVSAQTGAPIEALYLLPARLSTETRRTLETGSISQRRARLASLHVGAAISAQASAALSEADLILYGPGTPFSSLLPSYLVAGVAAAIERNENAARVHVVNLREDHDARGLDAETLVRRTLGFLGDAPNARRLVTHALFDPGTALRENGVRCDPLPGDLGLLWMAGDFEDPQNPGKHDGRRTVDAALGTLETAPWKT